jgi:metallo-beta-lactamase class B
MKHFVITIVFISFFGIIKGQDQSDTVMINENLYLIKLTDHSWIHVSHLNGFTCNGFLLADNKKAFLFDTPSYDSTTIELTNYIQDILKLKIMGFVTNDWHIDSQGGLGVINELKIPGYSNEMTREIAKSKGLPITSNGFQDSLKINFESLSIELYYLGAAHTMDNIVAWIPEEKILFADCMVKGLVQNNLGFTGDGDLNAYSETLRKVMERFSNVKYVIPGHGNYGGYDLITHTKEIADRK